LPVGERQIEIENRRQAEQLHEKRAQLDSLRQKKASLARELEHESRTLSMQEAKCETI
jgi:hypothetical protein